MTLLLTFLLVTFALFALFWGGTLVAQGYLYQQPTDRLPLRAAAAAALVGAFLTFWVWVDKRSPGKYDTFFEFAPYSTTTFTEFEAVRWTRDPAAGAKKVEFKKDAKGGPAETTARFKRAPGGATPKFVEERTGREFKLNDSDTMTAALLLKGPDGGAPVRFKADLKEDKRTGGLTYSGERRFTEENGSRYVRGDQLGVLYVPSNSVVVLALLINFLLFVVWFAAFWPVLRFGVGHALGLAAVFGLVTMLLVMPLLFKPNRAPRAIGKPEDGNPASSAGTRERPKIAPDADR
ncbi:MAG: hypothetical protein JWO38_3806 [Gemmataceae bacterium]|nr:hypothetical protein [Gemmataceae bacterium]